jgi:hypothetical protein
MLAESLSQASSRTHRDENQLALRRYKAEQNKRLKEEKGSVGKTREVVQARAFHHHVPSYLESLIDIDGDGNVDSEEYALMHTLERIPVADIDGDGKVDDSEIMVAKQLAGKKILAKRFVDRNRKTMWRYAREFGDSVPYEEKINKIAYAKDYRGLVNHLKLKEQAMVLSSSDRLKDAFYTPPTARMVTGRNVVHRKEYMGLR